MNVEDFRSMLGLEDKYLKFSELNKFVIKPAIKELNEKSNLTVNVDMIKKGRTIVSLHFQFKENKQIKIIL
ncbi:replication initiation protein [Xenorhabdus bovienii]|uniref:replication initiation protein n=1 Tax=Xenorhabdus bovienii TaxID=40576 RepID=UPI0030BA0605